MAYAAKATTGGTYRRNTKIAIGILALFGTAAIVMAIYSFVTGGVLFGIGCIIAMILCFSYVIIRSNSVFTTYLAADKKNVYMRTWSNGFVPYRVEAKPAIVSEFIPAPTTIIEIPIEDIETVVIGNKNYIKRMGVSNTTFKKAIHPYEVSKDPTRRKTVAVTEYFYVSTVDSECYFMPIAKFAPRDVSRVIQFIRRTNPAIDVKISSREFRETLKERK